MADMRIESALLLRTRPELLAALRSARPATKAEIRKQRASYANGFKKGR
jgi:hypothetical protein